MNVSFLSFLCLIMVRANLNELIVQFSPKNSTLNLWMQIQMNPQFCCFWFEFSFEGSYFLQNLKSSKNEKQTETWKHEIENYQRNVSFTPSEVLFSLPHIRIYGQLYWLKVLKGLSLLGSRHLSHKPLVNCWFCALAGSVDLVKDLYYDAILFFNIHLYHGSVGVLVYSWYLNLLFFVFLYFDFIFGVL